jgi:flagellar biosynthesis/type III secretory pathway M-ring protein FliF/YscJ
MRKRKHQAVEIQGQIEAAAKVKAAGADDVTRQIESQLAENSAIRERQTADALHALKMGPATTKKGEVLTKHILEEVKKDPKVVAQIIRTWVNEGADKR